jgi:hypothetical protein
MQRSDEADLVPIRINTTDDVFDGTTLRGGYAAKTRVRENEMDVVVAVHDSVILNRGRRVNIKFRET